MTDSGLRLSNDRIPVHLGEVLLGYARFRLDGHLQMINAPDDEERARSQPPPVGFRRPATLIRYHLQNADIAQSDRGELAATADLLDLLDDPGATVPSYHDLHITTDEIPRTSIFNLPHNIEVTCDRVGGWEVWDSSSGNRKTWRLLGGEYNAEPEDNEEGWPVRGGLRLDVAGFVIVDSLGKASNG